MQTRDLIVLTLLILCASMPLFGETGQSDRPNVLMICIDDLNDWVGCLGGHPDAHTPHIDRLAGQGTRFEHAQTHALALLELDHLIVEP